MTDRYCTLGHCGVNDDKAIMCKAYYNPSQRAGQEKTCTKCMNSTSEEIDLAPVFGRDDLEKRGQSVLDKFVPGGGID